MLTKLPFAVVVPVLLFTVAVAPAAAASANPVARLESVVIDDILWLEASLPDATADVVKIEVRAPYRDDTRHLLWQRCTLPYSGSGSYRCGIDISEGSLAHKRNGCWKAKVIVDGKPAGRATFLLSREHSSMRATGSSRGTRAGEPTR